MSKTATATAPASTAPASTVAPVRIRNVKRAQWFWRFPVSTEVAHRAEGVVGCKVEHAGSWRVGKRDRLTAICTIAVGDAEAHPSELPPEIEIPGEVWAACLAEPTIGPTVRGLVQSGEIAVYAPSLPVGG